MDVQQLEPDLAFIIQGYQRWILLAIHHSGHGGPSLGKDFRKPFGAPNSIVQEAEVRKSRPEDLDLVSNLPSLNAEASIHRGSLKYVPGAKSFCC